MRVITLLTLLLLSPNLLAKEAKDFQLEHEDEIKAVVRNKIFYKENHGEIALMGGVMPYDSLVNHYLLGGQLTYHINDYLAIQLDGHVSFPTVTSFSEALVSDKGISNLQTTKIKYLATANLVLSPLYGKIRFFGKSTLHFDVFLTAGGGIAGTELTKVSTTTAGQPATVTALGTASDPTIDFGLGFKLFFSQTMGVTLDLRDYLVNSQTYGQKAFKSNYTVFLGFCFFLPSLG